ncbi:MAG: hypothetical protein KJ011_06055 [Burkholderiaceae bacterium]|nr:hypothetical protein [Burkholderiaceae bacterium]
MLHEGLRLIEQREQLEAVKLKAMQEAAGKGWTDIAASHDTDLADDQLEDFIGQLGQRAARRARTTG